MLVEEGAVAVEHSVCYTGGKELGQSEPGAAVGFEAERRTAPSGCGTASPEAEAWASAGGRVPDSGPARRVTGWDAALWGSEELTWVPQACSAARRRLPPSVADWWAEREDQESRAAREERGNVRSLSTTL